jgi:hypothetical protein
MADEKMVKMIRKRRENEAHLRMDVAKRPNMEHNELKKLETAKIVRDKGDVPGSVHWCQLRDSHIMGGGGGLTR